jgi:DNA-directed RNA polymerase specialized sigma24 family protein
MDAATAYKIIRALADGRDPSNGAPLARESVFQKPEVIRAMFAAADALEDLKEAEQEEAAALPGAGGAWSREEEAQLVASFESGMSQANIARQHGRTRGAIHSRLKRLGLIADGDTPAASQTSSRSRVFNRKPVDDVPF